MNERLVRMNVIAVTLQSLSVDPLEMSGDVYNRTTTKLLGTYIVTNLRC